MNKPVVIIAANGCRSTAESLIGMTGGNIVPSLSALPTDSAYVVHLFDSLKSENLTGFMSPPVNLALDISARNATVEEFVSHDDKQGSLELRISTASALQNNASHAFMEALACNMKTPLESMDGIHDALQEAVGNAIMYGNLGLDSALRKSMETLSKFGQEMNHRLTMPEYANLPLTVSAHWKPNYLGISVQDVGAGFTPNISDDCYTSDPLAKSGRGLKFIQEVAETIEFMDSGRCIQMSFSRQT